MIQINLSSFHFQQISIQPIQITNLTNQNKQLLQDFNSIFQQNISIDDRSYYIPQLKTLTTSLQTSFSDIYQLLMNYIHYTFNQINQLLHSSDPYGLSIIYSITCYNGGVLYYLLLKAIDSKHSEKISEIKSLINISDSLQQLLLFEMNEDDRHLSGFKSSLICINEESLKEVPKCYIEIYHQMKQIQLPNDLTEDYASSQHFPFLN